MNIKRPSILTEEGNPFIRRSNQEKRYAKMVWPIPELTKEEERWTHQTNGIGEALATIAFAIHDVQQKEYKVRQELKKSRDEVREEFKAEIESLKAQLDNSLAIFSDLEQERYDAFVKKHYELHNNGKHKRDDGITIHIVGTGIGNCYKLECPVCHEKEDITDVSAW